MTEAKRLACFLVTLSFLLAVRPIDSRYIKTKRAEKELSKAPTNSLEDDVDLETFFEDYYDDLWQYLESWDRDPGKSKKSRKGEQERTDLVDYEYMSDMPAGEPEVDGKKFKGLDEAGGGRETITTGPNVNESGVNENSGDGGIPDIIRSNRESNSQEEYPLRSKQMRLKSIIDQVLSFRGGNPKLNESVPDARQFNALREIYEKNIKKIKTEEWTSSYTEKVQSFYPSCDLPRNTDEDVWTDSYSMNLLFDLDYPSPQEDSTVMIVTAKLRLYKLPQGVSHPWLMLPEWKVKSEVADLALNLFNGFIFQENYSIPSTETSSPKMKWERPQVSYGVFPVDDDRQIRVSVYWYTRSLRRHRVKKRLLDSQMLSLYEAKWAEFNIRPAVRTWKESGKNFGLVVNVEDEDGTLLPAEQYIQTMNCSKWTATVRPIPSIIMDKVNQYYIDNPSEGKNETFEETKSEDDKHKIYPYQPFLYPIIDLRTREVPNSDVKNIALVNSAKKALETKYLSLQQKGFNVTNDSVGSFLKKNNLDFGDITKLSRVDKSVPRKSETLTGEFRVSNFQNVPIGSPRRVISEKVTEPKDETEVEKGEERVMPRIRHNRKQWDMYQKTTNSYSRSRNDFNATDHH